MVQVGEIVSEYKLSKSNNSNELTNVDDRHEVAKVSDDTKLVPLKKNYLVEVGKGGIEVFAKAGKALVEVTGRTLTVIGNKLAKLLCIIVVNNLRISYQPFPFSDFE